jgi:phosphopentomutase
MYKKEGEVTMYNESNSRTVRKTDRIVDGVIDKIIDRALVGKKKYGVTLEREDLSLSEWLTHLQEELLDAANYIERIKKVIDGKKGPTQY